MITYCAKHQKLKLTFSNDKSIHEQQVGVLKTGVLKISTIFAYVNSQHRLQWCACIDSLSLINNLGIHQCNIKNYINTSEVTGQIRVSLEHS